MPTSFAPFHSLALLLPRFCPSVSAACQMFPAGNLAALQVYPDEHGLYVGREPWGTASSSLLLHF